MMLSARQTVRGTVYGAVYGAFYEVLYESPNQIAPHVVIDPESSIAR